MRGRLVLDPYRVLDAGSGQSRRPRLPHARRRVRSEHARPHASEYSTRQARARRRDRRRRLGRSAPSCKELARSGIPTLALTRKDVDLLGPSGSDQLKSKLSPDDAVVFVSAVAPAKNAAQLMANLRMAEAALAAFAAVPPAHLALHQLRCGLRRRRQSGHRALAGRALDHPRHDARCARADVPQRISRSLRDAAADADLRRARSALGLRPEPLSPPGRQGRADHDLRRGRGEARPRRRRGRGPPGGAHRCSIAAPARSMP